MRRERPDAADEQREEDRPTKVHDLFAAHHAELVRRTARSLSVDLDTAEEAVQFAWLKLLQNRVEGDRLVGWLYTVAKRRALELSGKARRERAVAEACWERPQHVDVSDLVDRRATVRRLAVIVRDELSENQRRALRLWAHGYRYHDIAAELGKSYTWVNRHVTEGLARLRSCMSDLR